MPDKKVFVVKLPMGVFAFSEGKLLQHEFFDKKPERAAEQFCGEISAPFLSTLGNYDIFPDNESAKFMRKHMREYAISLGFAENDADLNEFLAGFGFFLTKNSMGGNISNDRLLIQAYNALEDIRNISNLLAERLYEWYTLHYPELKLKKNFFEDIINYGRRDNFPNFKKSSGIDISEKDEKIFKKIALLLKNLRDEEKALEIYVQQSVKEIMPNVASLLEPLLAAKFLALAGSLEKLARMTASTIQLLGAEKALFRHLHKKGKSPKYGIIYTSSYVQSAPEEKRGRVSRILASKIMVASRIDFYSKRNEAEKLKNDLIAEIKKLTSK